MDILASTSHLVGRRSKISRQDMMDIMSALAMEGLCLGNPYVSGTVVYSDHDGDTGHPTDEQDVPRAARTWANLCDGITCISVGSGLRDGAVRYDEPGRMHPLQKAELMFVPETLGDYEYDQIGQMRRHARRVLVVRADPPLTESVAEPIERKLAQWQRDRNTCDERHLSVTDSRHAYRLGLCVLSQLLLLRAEIDRAGSPYAGMGHRLAHMIHLAIGEAQDRLRRETGDETIAVPGIPAYDLHRAEED